MDHYDWLRTTATRNEFEVLRWGAWFSNNLELLATYNAIARELGYDQ